MEVVSERVCGLDVHQLTVVACALIVGDSRKQAVERREFSAMTDGLRDLCAWLLQHRVTHVAMEGTGSYWLPVYAALEQHQALDLWVVNAHHIKKVPGRKTDWNDARWIAQLLQWGLLRKSFVPTAEFRALRDLTRSRRSLVQERSRQLNRLQKVLVTANVKLSAVIADILGVSGLAMVRALIAGTQTPLQIAQLARGAMRKKIPTLVRALEELSFRTTSSCCRWSSTSSTLWTDTSPSSTPRSKLASSRIEPRSTCSTRSPASTAKELGTSCRRPAWT